MDLVEDKPRQHPKPVPFSQSSLLQPAVPEVSLLLQENESKSEKKNDSFSGTEFQTYNSWRWKHMKHNISSSDSSTVKQFTSPKDCHLIKDKYFTLDLEKRKNEILYGELEEPRRPLPPRANPVLPACVEPFFSNSFDDSKSFFDNTKKREINETPVTYPVTKSVQSSLNQKPYKKELGNSEKLYDIISEQNKQMQVLQNQIEQLLKLQEVKDHQIEQLLKSQELKEKKIKHLLQSLGSKEKEIEQLINSKLKLESHVEELLKFQENIQKEKFNMQKKLDELKPKEMFSVGVMACVQLADASTSATFEIASRECEMKNLENSYEQQISVLRESSKLDEKDRSLSLHSSDLPVIEENAPTPQSSIHVDIQDFPDSSDESEIESGIPSNSFCTTKEVQSSPLGYTFYNNVLTQLKDIIQNSGEKENKQNSDKLKIQEQDVNVLQANCSPDNQNQVLVHLLNTYDKENVLPVTNEEQIERVSDKFQNFCIKDTSSPSDISLKINALAMKYLKQEQISEFGLQNQIPNSCQHDVTIYNVTNLSFGSMRYLDRYQMLPQLKGNQKQFNKAQINEHSPAEFIRRKRRLTVEENIKSSVGNILDISTLNQQPKLL